MRQRTSMITTMEGISKPVYRIARELSQNSRSGLTIRFLSKKLELPQEEIEYLVDVNHKLLYTDLTKIKLPAEGVNAVKRISEGLENLGDAPALFRKIKSLSAHDFRLLEEQLGLTAAGTKKGVAQHILDNFYNHPDSGRQAQGPTGLWPTGGEAINFGRQQKAGIRPQARNRAMRGGTEFEVEQALWELFRGAALFEMFRFDAEERAIRMGGLLSEIRQWRETRSKYRRKKTTLKALRTPPGHVSSRTLDMTDALCHLIATIAAKPARVRGDGELFREDLRRLSDTVDEDHEPSLSTCLWAAEGVEWLAHVDNELHAPDLEDLLDVEHFDRHRILFDWIMSTGNEGTSRRLLANAPDPTKSRMGHPILRRRADEIADPTAPEIKALVGHMIETMDDAEGTGLAAPQIHVPIRLVVMHTPGEDDDEDTADDEWSGITILVNPLVEPLGDEMEDGWEGCLSVPDLRGMVPRYKRIRYSGTDHQGGVIERTVEGLHARVVQHECDHLDGILYPERMTDMTKLIFESEFRHLRKAKAEDGPEDAGEDEIAGPENADEDAA